MINSVNPAESGEEANYWNPFSSILAAVLLLIIVFVFSISAQGGTESAAIENTHSSQYNPETQDSLKDREAAVESKERSLANREAVLKGLSGVRTAIIDELAEKLSELKLPVEINHMTGNVRFTDDFLFGVNNDQLNTEGQQCLKTFMPAYLSVLLSSENAKYLDQIIIEGHADSDGTYSSNLSLSEKRANTVVNFILAQNLAATPDGTSAVGYFTVSARSHNVPVLVDGVPDRSLSRRVEFVFKLKDDEILKEMQELYKGEPQE